MDLREADGQGKTSLKTIPLDKCTNMDMQSCRKTLPPSSFPLTSCLPFAHHLEYVMNVEFEQIKSQRKKIANTSQPMIKHWAEETMERKAPYWSLFGKEGRYVARVSPMWHPY